MHVRILHHKRDAKEQAEHRHDDGRRRETAIGIYAPNRAPVSTSSSICSIEALLSSQSSVGRDSDSGSRSVHLRNRRTYDRLPRQGPSTVTGQGEKKKQGEEIPDHGDDCSGAMDNDWSPVSFDPNWNPAAAAQTFPFPSSTSHAPSSVSSSSVSAEVLSLPLIRDTRVPSPPPPPLPPPHSSASSFPLPSSSPTSPTSPTFDASREWQLEHEVIAFQWKTICDERAKAHVQTAVFMKVLYHLMSFPIYTVPLIVTQMEKFDEGRGEWASLLKYLLTVNAVLAGLNTAANFGKRSEQHFNLESQFSRLGKVIGVMLETPRKERQRPQSFLVTSAYQMESLFAISPNLACAKFAARCVSALYSVRRCFKCRCRKP